MCVTNNINTEIELVQYISETPTGRRTTAPLDSTDAGLTSDQNETNNY